MASDIVRIEIDGEMKAEAEAALAGIGLTLSDAVRLLLAHVAAGNALPFGVLCGNGSSKPAPTNADEPSQPGSEDEELARELARLTAEGMINPPIDPTPIDWDAFWALPRPTVSDEAVKEAMDWEKGEF